MTRELLNIETFSLISDRLGGGAEKESQTERSHGVQWTLLRVL